MLITPFPRSKFKPFPGSNHTRAEVFLKYYITARVKTHRSESGREENDRLSPRMIQGNRYGQESPEGLSLGIRTHQDHNSVTLYTSHNL